MVEDELALLGRAHEHRLTRPAMRTAGSRWPRIDRTVVGEGQRRRITGREGLLLGLIEFGLRSRVILLDVVVDVLTEGVLGVGERNPVLRTLRSRD